MRSILPLLFLLILLLSCHCPSPKGAIPLDTAVIFPLEDTEQGLKDLPLQQYMEGVNLEHFLKSKKSVIEEDKNANSYFVLVQKGKSKFSPLLLTQGKLLKENLVEHTNYQGVKVYSCAVDSTAIYCSKYKNICLVGTSAATVESAIDQAQNPSSHTLPPLKNMAVNPSRFINMIEGQNLTQYSPLPFLDTEWLTLEVVADTDSLLHFRIANEGEEKDTFSLMPLLDKIPLTSHFILVVPNEDKRIIQVADISTASKNNFQLIQLNKKYLPATPPIDSFHFFSIYENKKEIFEDFTLPSQLPYCVPLNEVLFFGESPEKLKDYLKHLISNHTLIFDEKLLAYTGSTAYQDFFIYQDNTKTGASLALPTPFNILVAKENNFQFFKEKEENKAALGENTLSFEVELKQGKYLAFDHSPPRVLLEGKDTFLYAYYTDGRLDWKQRLPAPIDGAITILEAKKGMSYWINDAWYISNEKGESARYFPRKESPPLSDIFKFTNENGDCFLMYVDVEGRTKVYDMYQEMRLLPELNQNLGISIVAPIYFQVDNQDYFVNLNYENKLYCQSRKGEAYFEPLQLEGDFIKKLYFDNTTSPYHRIVLADKSGKLTVVNLLGQKFHLQMDIGSPLLDFEFKNILEDSRKDYISLTGDSLAIFAYDEKNTFSKRLSIAVKGDPTHIISHKAYFGYMDTKRKKIYLYDEKGTLLPKFPLAGEQLVHFLEKDNELYLIALDERQLLTYRIY